MSGLKKGRAGLMIKIVEVLYFAHNLFFFIYVTRRDRCERKIENLQTSISSQIFYSYDAISLRHMNCFSWFLLAEAECVVS